MAKITLVDDDENIVTSVSLALESHGHEVQVLRGWEQVKPGKMTPAEYDRAIGDLVAYMQWMAEPEQNSRVRLGVWVLVFLAFFIIPLAHLFVIGGTGTLGWAAWRCWCARARPFRCWRTCVASLPSPVCSAMKRRARAGAMSATRRWLRNSTGSLASRASAARLPPMAG